MVKLSLTKDLDNMCEHKKPIIISYPRSGTHLVAKTMNYDLFGGFWVPLSVKVIKNIPSNYIMGIHNIRERVSYKVINFILNEMKPIYIAREPKDTLTSFYAAFIKNKEIDCVKEISGTNLKPYTNLIEVWKGHVNKWFENDFLFIRYENLITNFNIEVEKIEDYLKVNLSKTKPKLNECNISRKGVIGDYKNYMSNELIKYIDDKCSEEIKIINKLLL